MTSDSLAGESVKQGGSFAANSSSREPMGQPSSSTTTNTTDTSGATTLGPAPTADAREATEAWSEGAQLNAGRNLNSGAGATYAATASSGVSGSGGVGGSVGEASQPKGQNLQEGGFSSDAPNASYTADIGGKNDPGRAALGAFEASGAAPSGGAGARDQKVTGEGQFSNLDETSA